MRKGFTLLETIVAMAILLLMIGLLLPAIQMVRSTATQLDDRSKMRQMGLGLHQYASAMDNRLPGTKMPSIIVIPPYPYPTTIKWGAGNDSPLYNLFPFIEPEFPAPYGKWVANRKFVHFTTKLYLSKADPTTEEPLWPTNTTDGATSFPVNALVFEGRPSLTTSIPDGLSSTAWLSQRYFHTQSRYNIATHLYTSPGLSEDTEYQSNRSCTFADITWRDIVPVINSGGRGRTLPSHPSVTFQDRPRPELSDGRQLQSFHRSGLLLGMLDGSVRTIAPGVEPPVFWSLITPNGGEIAD